MPDDRFGSDAWLRALTLTERLASLRAGVPRAPAAPVDLDRARQRLDRWRSQPPFTDRSVFERRLAADGTTEADLLTLLGEPPAALRARCASTPGWLSELAAAFERPATGGGARRAPVTGREVSFLDLVRPVIERAADRLHEHVAVLGRSPGALPFDPATIVGLCAPLVVETLGAMLSRTLVLELNVARLEGALTGDTPQQRFVSYASRLSRPEVALAVLEEYPVLAREVVKALERWVDVCGEFLQRLSGDWEAIRSELAPAEDPGPLVELSGAGDTHRGGRRVLIATFRSGFRVVYKPKSHAVDRHFQDLLRWVNDRGPAVPFRTLRVLDRGTYGWSEHVARRGCATAGEVERFYLRMGGYLALFHVLQATDFHAENLLAMGEHPMPIDLEALFHPRPRGAQVEAADAGARALDRSVTRVGLLPERIWAAADSVGVDMSGMSNPEGQLTPFQVPQWKDQAKDTMQLVRERVPMLGTDNQPTLDGAPVSLLDHTGAVEEGFRRTYRLLLEHRPALLADDGPLAWFGDDEVRAILRMTQTYASLLRESFHPDLLRDALDRDRLLDRLWVQVEGAPHLAAVIPAERADLLEGDLPMFTARPRSRDAWSSRGERIPDFFAESGLDLARRRMAELGEADLARQLWIVRASLATVATGVEAVRRRAAGAPATTGGSVGRGRLLAAARAVGDRLEQLAIRGERDASVTWLGLNPLDEQHWAVTPLGVDLYDGVPGVALFLAYLGALTGEERHARLARAALATLRAQVPVMKRHLTMIGGFTGWGGVVHALTHLAALWGEPALLDEAEALVELLHGLVARDDQHDVIGGSAGAIAALLALHRWRPSARTLAAARACGDHLDARAQPAPGGEGRAVPAAAARGPLSGFSHGAGGMAWALLELAAVTGEERYRATALDLIRYERTLYSPEAENWLDLRDWVTPDQGPGAPPACATFWCHGAPGIGLGRACSLRHLDDAATRQEIAAAVRTTLRSGFGHGHSLCHGDLGNLELLLHASRIDATGAAPQDVERVTTRIVESIEAEGWLCGNPLSVESPGLLTGLAGIGYGLLRVADPERVPPVLVLAPPAGGGAYLSR